MEEEKKIVSFSPREIVSELDRYVIGQKDAKKAVAIALRNRWRRQELPPELKEEVLPIYFNGGSNWSWKNRNFKKIV